jgi:branched-chain amino acid transport system substrate-binding protein
MTQVVPFPGDVSLPFVARYQVALQSFDRGVEPGFVSLEGYLVGRLIIAALEKVDGEPTRSALLAAIYSNTFDFQGVHLTYGSNDNRGSDMVFLTMIQPDGSFKAITSLARTQ